MTPDLVLPAFRCSAPELHPRRRRAGAADGRRLFARERRQPHGAPALPSLVLVLVGACGWSSASGQGSAFGGAFVSRSASPAS